jgi:hypothetical protein
MTDEPLIDAPKLRDSVEHTAARLAELPSRGVIRPRVTTRLLRDVTAEARFEQYGRKFSFRNDEPPGRGGAGVEPTSIRYFLSGLAFCLQVWLAKGAALVGCEIDSVELDVEAQLDMRREYLLPTTGTAEFLVADLRVTSGSSSDLVLAMADEADRRCPLVHAVALPLHWRVTHNGAVVRDDRPDQRPTA